MSCKHAFEPSAPRQVSQHHSRTIFRSLLSEWGGGVQKRAGKRWGTQILIPILLTASDNYVRLSRSWFFQLCGFMCENAHTTVFSTWPKIAPVEYSEMGDLYQAWAALCNLAKNGTYTFRVTNAYLHELNLYLWSPCVFTSFSIPHSLHTCRRWVRFLATSPDHFWEWINAWKELCHSWMGSSYN